MADFDLKAATPSRALPPGSFLFGAASQAQEDPSVYPISRFQRALVGLGHIGIITVLPRTGTFHSFGCNGVVNPGTVTFRDIDDASMFTSLMRIGVQTAAATAGSSGQLRTNSTVIPLLRNRAGLRCHGVFGISDPAPVANARMFVGLNTQNASIPNNTVTSSQLNCIGLGTDSGETTFSIMHNDGAGTATKIPLGANFPADTSNADIYAFTLIAQPGAATVEYLVERYNSDPVTPDATASGSIGTDLPSATTGLQFHFWRNNGATALAASFDFFGYTEETGWGVAF
jgi:hypothetical protein